jgi:uncharacterized Zn finger protein
MPSTYAEIETICPKCGSTVNVTQVCTYPPTTCYRCTKCDYHHDDYPLIKKVTVVAPED